MIALLLACTDPGPEAVDSGATDDSVAADDSSEDSAQESVPQGDCDALTVCGTLAYDGTATGDALYIVLHDAEPPTGPPLGLEELSEFQFPVEFSVDVPYAGPYYYRVFLDVDPTDGSYPNDELDPQNDPEASPHSEVPESGGAVAVELVLLDPS